MPSPSLAGLAVPCKHIPKTTRPEKADAWPPCPHIVIPNLKRFLLSTYHGAVRPHRLQDYLDESFYRLNRRLWQN